MYIFIGLALVALGSIGCALHPNESTPLDGYLWIPAFWVGAFMLAGSVLVNLIWGYWP